MEQYDKWSSFSPEIGAMIAGNAWERDDNIKHFITRPIKAPIAAAKKMMNGLILKGAKLFNTITGGELTEVVEEYEPIVESAFTLDDKVSGVDASLKRGEVTFSLRYE